MNHRRFLLVCLALLLSLVQLTYAQAIDWSGRWAGTLIMEGQTTGLEITLARSGEKWTSSLKWRMEGEELAPTVDNLLISGDTISFSVTSEGKTAKFTGKVSGDSLTGSMEGFQGDKKIAAGTFTLKRGGEMPALPVRANPGQVADPNFDAKVAHPAYAQDGPRVLFDEAHNNFHTATGRYKPFADLIGNDGYKVVPNKEKFSAELLTNFQVLIISNALGSTRMNDPGAVNPAFTDAESDAVREWVQAGGALLLIADHAPMGAANQILGQRFGVDMSKKYTIDPENFQKESNNRGFIVYTRESGRLADHPITRGRNDSERINKVVAFTGQSLKGPAESVAFMKLADSAQDVFEGAQPVSAAGRAQGLAIEFGKGRVIVMGEAGMLSAQIVGPERMPFGMNVPGIDNRQLVLNMLHWLTRKI
jgi:hypothetical protein